MFEKRIAFIINDLDKALPAGESIFNDELFCDLENIISEMLEKIDELNAEIRELKGE